MTHRRRKTDARPPAPVAAPPTSPLSADPFDGLSVDFDSDGLSEGIREGKKILDEWERDFLKKDLAGWPDWVIDEILRERGL